MARKPGTRFVRKAQRELLEPAIARFGFDGAYPEYRRDWQEERHFLLIMPRKYGGGFSLQAAWAHQSDGYTDLAQTDFDNRASMECVRECGLLDKTTAMRSVGDFDYEHIADDLGLCRSLVAEAVALLPALDLWLRTRQPSCGVSCRGHRMRHMKSKQYMWHCVTAATGAFDLEATRPSVPGSDANDQTNLAPEYRPEQEPLLG